MKWVDYDIELRVIAVFFLVVATWIVILLMATGTAYTYKAILEALGECCKCPV